MNRKCFLVGMFLVSISTQSVASLVSPDSVLENRSMAQLKRDMFIIYSAAIIGKCSSSINFSACYTQTADKLTEKIKSTENTKNTKKMALTVLELIKRNDVKQGMKKIVDNWNPTPLDALDPTLAATGKAAAIAHNFIVIEEANKKTN